MPKGGMSKNPFAGNDSMNTLDDDFMSALTKGDLTVEQAIALRIIKMSVRDYLYFGLGKNGVTPEKFLEAYGYLYRVRPEDATTGTDGSFLQGPRTVGSISTTASRKILTPEILARCFETHYSISGLDQKISISKFLIKLQKKREGILRANNRQIIKYMDVFRNQEWKQLSFRKGKHSFPRKHVIRTLVSPKDPEALARLYLFGRKMRPEKVKADTQSISSNLLIYKALLF